MDIIGGTDRVVAFFVIPGFGHIYSGLLIACSTLMNGWISLHYDSEYK